MIAFESFECERLQRDSMPGPCRDCLEERRERSGRRWEVGRARGLLSWKRSPLALLSQVLEDLIDCGFQFDDGSIAVDDTGTAAVHVAHDEFLLSVALHHR